MNDARSYNKNNDVQINHAKEFIPYFLSKMKFKSGENVLDFGSGSGNVTKNILLPELENAYPDSERKIYGVDIMPAMTEFASKNYAHSQIIYETLDIQKDKAEFPCKFDKVFSFHVLHWLSDQALCRPWSQNPECKIWGNSKFNKDFLTKLSPLMSQSGEICFYFISKSAVFFVYEILRKDPEFAAYITNGEKFIPKSIYSPNPTEDFAGFMNSAGFAVHECSLLPKDYIFSDTDEMMKFWMAFDPFIGGLPSTLQDSYKQRFLQELSPSVEKFPLSEDESGLKVRIVYDVMLVIGQKL